MDRWVEINFDCLPLRSIARLDAPLDASPQQRDLWRRIKSAVDRHGTHNSYYLHNAQCTYHLTNCESLGMLQFRFEGTLLTDSDDRRTQRCDLEVHLLAETCNWLTQPIVQWFRETVPRSVAADFDRYIEAGDLERTKKRLETVQSLSDQAGGFRAMHL